MKRITTFLLSVLSVLCLQAQNKHTISGYITDKASKETLIGATILDLKSGRGTITNEYGFYSITLPDGPIEMRTGYVGYKPVVIPFTLYKDTVINIGVPTVDALNEVTIYGNREILGVRGSQMSAVDIPIEQIKADKMVASEVIAPMYSRLSSCCPAFRPEPRQPQDSMYAEATPMRTFCCWTAYPYIM